MDSDFKFWDLGENGFVELEKGFVSRIEGGLCTDSVSIKPFEAKAVKSLGELINVKVANPRIGR